MSAPSAPAGRRTAAPASRVNPLVLLAVVVPLLTAAVAFGVAQPRVQPRSAEPVAASLTRADRGCPSAPSGRGEVLIADRHEEAGGQVELRSVAKPESDPKPMALDAGTVATLDDPDAVLVTGVDDVAPGLLATRVGAGDLAAVVCPAPLPEVWFTGLGARAEHASVIELQNPDVGAAVVDVSVFTRQGPAVVPELLGIRVPGRSTYALDLAAQLPRRGDLAIRLVVTRGRLSATVRDRLARIGATSQSVDWLAPQAAPALQTTLLGLPGGRGRRMLTLANPGTDQARVTLKLVTADSTFAPADLQEVQVRPGSLVNVRLDKALTRAAGGGSLGVEVTGTEPVTSALVSVIDGDLVAATEAPSLSEAAALLPAGERTVIIAGASSAGLGTLEFRSSTGRIVRSEQVELTPGRAFAITAPRKAALALLTVERTTASAVVLTQGTGGGAVALPFLAPDESSLVPAVRPADR